jgi:hypothetical protein
LHAFYEETVDRTFDNVAKSNGWVGIDDFRTFHNDDDSEVRIVAIAN